MYGVCKQVNNKQTQIALQHFILKHEFKMARVSEYVKKNVLLQSLSVII